MSMGSILPLHLMKLIAYLKKLPGVGTKTAERFAFELLKWEGNDLANLAQILAQFKEKVLTCSHCSCLMDGEECKFCNQREGAALCIIASAKDAFAIEQTHSYKGYYHVIEHLLSPLDGRMANTLRIDRIAARIQTLNIQEVILAFDSTIEGDTTALYLKHALSQCPVSISRIAFGLPMGSSLEYIDGGTLARAFTGRHSF